MKIIIDKDIPFIKGLLEDFAEVEYHKGKDITKGLAMDADALIVRTRTKCDEALLAGTSVKMIATATIGYDHIDAHYCAQAGVQWTNAPGCNADSVVQYVGAVIAQWAKNEGFENVVGKTLGVVGVGNVGSRIVNLGEQLGMKVMMCDAPRKVRGDSGRWYDLEQLIAEADVLTLHTPLTYDGDDATYHLLDERMLEMLAKRPLLINAARGGVVEEGALKAAIYSNKVGFVAVDCWEGEPDLDLELLDIVDISTPHIAGYSADGKWNGTRMAVEAVCEYFGWDVDLSDKCPLDEKLVEECTLKSLESSYDVIADSERLRADADGFEKHRGDYPIRRENLWI